MSTSQIAVRLPNTLLAKVDELVASGQADSRADAVRTALEHLVQVTESHRVGRAIAAAYQRDPVGEPDEWGTLDMLADWGALAVMRDLERQEREAGLSEW
ncbi:MAG: ribbon-helix-helix domain-containing protein [Acidimicrobiia bacterium]|nr:ribbon-helix-helix domain-containing protein [Acidimicrobiia bacterium]